MCVITCLASSITAAIASGIGTAASAVGSGLASVGIGTGISAGTAATIGSVGAAGLVGGVQGALYGTALSAALGQNMGQGALLGGLTGGVLSGLGEFVQIEGGIPIPGTDYTIGGGGSTLFNQTLDKMLPAVGNPSMPYTGGETNIAQIAGQMEVNAPNWSAELAAGITDPALKTQMQMNAVSALPTAGDATKDGSVAASMLAAGKDVAADVFTPGNLLRVGSAAVQVYSGIKQADLIKQDAENTMEMAEMEAGVHEMEASAAAEEARLHRVRAANEEKIAGYEKEGILKQKHQMAGKARAAAAGNGVLLEDRAESAPAMYEQDLAGEAAYEIDKVNMNTRTKQLTHLMNASAAAANAGIARQKAAMSRVRGLQAKQASNLKSTSALISGISGGLMSAGSIFA